MSNTNSSSASYDSTSKVLHWLVAFAVLGMLVVGGVMTDGEIEPTLRRTLYAWHKTVGILILFVTIFRLYWRHKNPPPPFPVDIMPPWQILAARLVHTGLYLLMLVIPLLGWALVSTGPYGISLFGVIPFPNLPWLHDLSNAHEIGEWLGEAHEGTASLIAVLVVVHIGATFKHHFVDRDNVLMRISPSCMHPFLKKIRGV